MSKKIKVSGTPLLKSRDGDAGYDIQAHVGGYVLSGERMLFLTQTRVKIPKGVVGYICPRSGLALTHGITILNAPGVIDSNYTGYLGLILYNTGEKTFSWEPGTRLAQIVFNKYEDIPSIKVKHLDTRGDQGFGSSGM